MAKKNWFETINDRVPAKAFKRNYVDDYFWPIIRDGFQNALFGDEGAVPIGDLMEELEGVGFQDRVDHYEFVTELVGNGDVKEDAVKIELLHESLLKENRGAYVKVTYEHKTETEHSFYSHSQTTTVTLPVDADENTVSAHFDEKNRVVVTVDKKVQKTTNRSRTIPIEGV